MTDVVEQFGIYHDPSKLGSTHDMRVLSEAQATREDLRPCSECWPTRTRADGGVPNLRENPRAKP